MLFLINKPYVSDFLIKTMKENGYRVVSTAVAREMIRDDSMNWISEEAAADVIEKVPHTPLYTNSENAFDHDLLGEDFENALMIRRLDIKKYPVFGFLFAETSAGNEEELTRILVSDLKKYIITDTKQ